jgi:hypothetical protein
MSDYVRCPACGHERDGHEVPPDAPGCAGSIEVSFSVEFDDSIDHESPCQCTLTPTEIDAVLAMRASDLAVTGTAERTTIAARDETVPGRHTAPAGDGKKPGPSCENCGDTGWVSTDVPGRAGPLTNLCPRMCPAAMGAAQARVTVTQVPPHVHEFRYSHTEQRPLGVGTNFEMVDVAICPGCAEVRRGGGVSIARERLERLEAIEKAATYDPKRT